MSAHPSTRVPKPSRRPGASLRLIEGEGREPAGLDEVLLELVSHGLNAEQIGVELGLPVDRARAELRRVVDSLGARNRTHAVALALKSGLIQ